VPLDREPRATVHAAATCREPQIVEAALFAARCQEVCDAVTAPTMA